MSHDFYILTIRPSASCGTESLAVAISLVLVTGATFLLTIQRGVQEEELFWQEVQAQQQQSAPSTRTDYAGASLHVHMLSVARTDAEHKAVATAPVHSPEHNQQTHPASQTPNGRRLPAAGKVSQNRVHLITAEKTSLEQQNIELSRKLAALQQDTTPEGTTHLCSISTQYSQLFLAARQSARAAPTLHPHA